MAKGFEKMNINRSLQVVSQVWRQGIGISKREMIAKFGGVSPLVHSFSTYNRYTGIVKEFVNYVREEFGVNRIDKLKPEHLDSFLQEKINKGYSEKTLKVNMCALEKYCQVIKRNDLYSHIKENFQSYYGRAREHVKTQPFSDPEKIINSLKDPAHRTVAELQYRTGARLGDVKKIKIDEDSKSVIIESSKGGRDRVLDFSDRSEKFERVKELREELDRHLEQRSWSDIRESYPVELKNVASSHGELYTGTHSFRVNYAQERFNELISQGYSELQADKILTQELGHNRIEMSQYYRK